MPDENTSRVAMLWPEDLKAQVRDRVGARGLTKFTLEAVEAKLGNHDVHQANSMELEDVRFLAQQLADAVARGLEYEDRHATLQEIGLPDWIDTTGWPEDVAELVPTGTGSPAAGSYAEEVEEIIQAEEVEAPGNDPTTYADDGVNLTERVCGSGVGGGEVCFLPPGHDGDHDPDAKVPDEPATPPKLAADLDSPTAGDLLDRIRDKAAEKGVDLTGLDLKPASTIDSPPAIEEPIAEEVLEEPRPEPSADVVTPDACPNCGSPLVAGECWECF